MTNQRQDAWSEEDDLLLAETVLRHVREGSTQLQAFDEVGDKLDRTSAAVGFRWNAIVRKKYEQALKIARRQRKERKRAAASNTPVAKPQKETTYQTRFEDPMDFENYHPLSERKSKSEQTTVESTPEPVTAETNPANTEFAQEEVPYKAPAPSVKAQSPVELDSVIAFLQNLKHQDTASSSVKQQNERLENECRTLRQQNEEYQNELQELKNNYASLKEDYQALLQIMDRARRMVLLQDQEELSSSKFKMDKNGNLEKVAK
ncbi:RsfA family transcriptional regulator [Pseudalkalibacillus sp. Hm43]|uniref:RsfA family transcriptional regulator n=1 Tax=Pseudalkalibacillus sp. Hm43 TaxID=3450742 RepID=UPI003F442132